MKKANGRYMQTECDRCGFTVHIDDTNRALLHGWGWRKDTGDLCPECYAEYKKMVLEFNAKNVASSDKS
mgnify:CR=1 FL=1